MEKTYGDGSYCSNVQLLPSDLNLTLESLIQISLGEKLKVLTGLMGGKTLCIVQKVVVFRRGLDTDTKASYIKNYLWTVS